MSAVLEAVSVTKTYELDSNIIKAVDDVSLEVCPGEFLALVGPSGSGKTTMLAMLAGLLAPTQGSIVIGGRQLGRMNDAQRTRFRREKVGFTFQSNNLVPYLTVQENVELMLRLNQQFDSAGKKHAQDVLARLGLGDRLKNLPSQLSGGQQQRVAIARAFQVVKTFADLIHAQNLAGIMVTHDLRMCQYVDKIIQMRDGKIARIITDTSDIHSFAKAHMLN
jgi:putative ABC transport system ATP-binding protein